MKSRITAIIGALRQETRFNIISNNLSNIQTVGFKKEIPIFKSTLNQALKKVGQDLENSIFVSFRQGEFQETGNPFDFGIDGEGFFKVETPFGIRYTRAGRFKLNQDKLLTTYEGYPLLGRGGPIKIEGQNITVEQDGAVKVNGNLVGKIDLVTFKDLKTLKKMGHHLFFVEGEEEVVVLTPRILQGFLESSNINVIEEMVQLMDAFRSYESCIKVIQSQDEMDSNIVNNLGKIR